MKRRLIIGLAAASAVVAACGNAGTHEFSGRSVQAMGDVGSSLPVPTAPANAQGVRPTAWTRSVGDLMAADAWAQCSFLQSPFTASGDPDASITPIPFTLTDDGDRYLQLIKTEMETSLAMLGAQATPNTQVAWIRMRSDAQRNSDPSTAAGRGVQLTVTPLSAYKLSTPNAPAYAAAEFQTSALAGMAATNLCIAQMVRQAGLGADAFFLSESDQQQLLEIVRERAQIAMVQFAGIANVLSAGDGSLPDGASLSAFQVVPYLQHWAGLDASRATGGPLEKWGQDFASAVQLHVTATEELADLLGRSASAGAPRGGSAKDRAEEIWGKGSWRHRLFGLLFGGDPLSGAGADGPPWTNMVGAGVPGVTLDSSLKSAGDWPDGTELPYVHTSITDPRAFAFLGLLRQADALMLATKSTGEVDIDATTNRAFTAVEAMMRTRFCTELASGKCRVWAPADVPASVLNGGPDSVLASRMQLTPEHARSVASLMAEAGGRALHITGSKTTVSESGTSWLKLSRQASFVFNDVDDVAPLFTRLSPYRLPNVVSGRVERTNVRAVSGSAPPVNVRVGNDQGLPAGGTFAPAIRVLGAVPSLVVVREAVTRALASGAPASATAFLGSLGGHIQDEVTAAVGAPAVLVRPGEVEKQVAWAQNGFPGGPTTWEILQPYADSAAGRALDWRVDVLTDGRDSFWSDSGTTFSYYAVPDDSRISVLARDSSGVGLDGKGVYDFARDGAPGTVSGSVLSSSSTRIGLKFMLPMDASKGVGRWTFVARRTGPSGVDFRALTGRVELTAWAINRAARLDQAPVAPVDGQYFASGGVLGGLARRALAPRDSNPSEPAFDAFGLPVQWLPPADPTTYGSTAGDNATSFFLRNAKQSAAEATQAVRDAIEGLLRAQKDAADLQASRTRAKGVLAIEKERVCGASSTCDLTTTEVDAAPGIAIPSSSPSCAQYGKYSGTATGIADTQAQGAVDCAVAEMLARLRFRVSVPRVVVSSDPSNAADLSRLYAPVAPSFSEYEGGTIQALLIRQWNALRKARDAAISLQAARAGASRRIADADTASADQDKMLAQLNARMAQTNDADVTDATQRQTAAYQRWTAACSAKDKLHEAIGKRHGWFDGQYHSCNADPHFNTDPNCMRCIADSSGPGCWGPPGGFGYTEHQKCPVGKDWHECKVQADPDELASLDGSQATCADAEGEYDRATSHLISLPKIQQLPDYTTLRQQFDAVDARRRAASEGYDAITTLRAHAQEIDDAAKEVASAAADIASALKEAELAKKRQDLETDLTAATQETSFALYRQYHQYDLWRARALLDGARRFAVTARRALENRFLVDLSAMKGDEAFVAAPAVWADAVYKYDLDMPGAVGLSRQTSSGAGGIDANQVLDYVGNLERFVQGYAVRRPLSTVSSDAQLINLPGPDAKVDSAFDPARGAWTVVCPSSSTCASGGDNAECPLAQDKSVKEACGANTTPVEAHLHFDLDSWGRWTGAKGVLKLDRRFNARWGRLAVHFAGTPRNCPLTDASCRRTPVFYSLEHRGPSIVIDYDGQWHALSVPVGFVQAANGLIPSLLPQGAPPFDPLGTGWGSPQVEAVGRSELSDRPLGGSYTIVVPVDATLALEGIDKVQLLITESYWVRQQG